MVASAAASGTGATSRIVLVGPTASGKSWVALALAARLGGEILGADSRQIYRGLEIGTGAPTREDRERIPHHLIAFQSPATAYSAGQFGRDARAALANVESRGRVPIVAGGSGLYVRALIEGLFEGPPADPDLRARLRSRLDAEGLPALRARLGEVDPEALGGILPGDSVRVLRALEVYEKTGRPISVLRKERAAVPLTARLFGLRWSRSNLVARIQSRIERQLSSGFLDEARELEALGLGEDAPGPRTLGYRELIAHLRGAMPLDAAATLIALRTRQLAKRQETWFRKRADVTWVDMGGEDDFDSAVEVILRKIQT